MTTGASAGSPTVASDRKYPMSAQPPRDETPASQAGEPEQAPPSRFEAPATAAGLRVIDPPGMQRFPIAGEIWQGSIDFTAVIPPGTTLWRTVTNEPAKTEMIRSRLHHRLMVIAPDLRVYDPRVGFFFTAEDVIAILQITRPTLTRWVRGGQVLAVRNPASPPSFPQVQFHRDGYLLPGLSGLLKLLKPVMTGWEIAQWLTTPTTAGQSPATLLDLGQRDTVTEFARRVVEEARAANAEEARGPAEDSDE